MNISLIISILIVTLTQLHASKKGDVLSSYESHSGRLVEKISWSDTQENHIIVSYPQNFNPSETYHINFWFPGTSGKPSSGIEDTLENYIGVGLSYLDKDKVPSNEYALKHWELCKNIE